MLNLSSITTLIFDFGGVLIDLDREACIAQFKALGIHNADTLLSNYTQNGVFQQLEEGLISADTFRDTIREQSRRALTDQEIDDAFKAFLLDVPQPKLDLLLQLKKQYRIFLLSNTNSIHFNWCIEKIFKANNRTLDDYFDHCYLSYQLNCAKPQPEIFYKLLHHSGVQPSECLFLDDGAQNCETAINLGFHTYLVKEHQDLRPLFTQ